MYVLYPVCLEKQRTDTSPSQNLANLACHTLFSEELWGLPKEISFTALGSTKSYDLQATVQVVFYTGGMMRYVFNVLWTPTISWISSPKHLWCRVRWGDICCSGSRIDSWFGNAGTLWFTGAPLLLNQQRWTSMCASDKVWNVYQAFKSIIYHVHMLILIWSLPPIFLG